MNELDGADIHAPGGLADDQHRGIKAEFPSDDHLLHIAAGQRGYRVVHAGHANIELFRLFGGVFLHLTAAQMQPAQQAELRPALLAHQQVFRHAGLSVHAGGHAVFRDEAHAPSANFARRFPAHVLAAQKHPAAGLRAHSHDALRQLGLAVALHAAHAHDFPCADGQTHLSKCGQHSIVQGAQALHPELFLAHFMLLAQFVKDHVPSHHQGGDLPFAGLSGLHYLHQTAALHHAHSVADLHDLRQPVGDQDHGHALLLHDTADDAEQLIRLLGGQYSGRFVQNQHLCAGAQGLEDLHPLLQAHAQFAGHIVRVHIQAIGLGQFPHSVPRRLKIIAQAFFRFVAQQDILCHGKAGHQLEVLMHHAHAHLHGLFRAMLRPDLFSVNENFAHGDRLHSVQQVHQGAFSCAVFPHQCEHFAPLNAQADVVIGQRSRVLFRHMGKTDDLLLLHPTSSQGYALDPLLRAGRAGVVGHCHLASFYRRSAGLRPAPTSARGARRGVW